MDFESSYHIHFVEELFSYPPKTPHETITPLLPLFPKHFHAFLTNALTIAHSNPSLTLGKVIIREHMLLKLPHTHQQPHITYLEGLIAPNHTSFSSHAFTRSWQVIRSPKRNNAFLRLTHITHINPVITNIPTSVYTAERYLRSAIGYTTTHAVCKTTSLQHLILPRLSTSLTTTYTQPALQCNFQAAITTACNILNYSPKLPINVYTDGSMKPSPSLNTLQHT